MGLTPYAFSLEGHMEGQGPLESFFLCGQLLEGKLSLVRISSSEVKNYERNSHNIIFSFSPAMFNFLDFIERNLLVDLRLVGGEYTWFRDSVNPLMSRIDRVFGFS